jgi:hypothetical protein
LLIVVVMMVPPMTMLAPMAIVRNPPLLIPRAGGAIAIATLSRELL